MSIWGFFYIRQINFWDVLDILIMWFLIYNLLKFIHGTRAMQMTLGIVALFVIQVIADFLHLTVLSKLITSTFAIIPIAIIVLFQHELRKGLASLGRGPFLGTSTVMSKSYLDQIFTAALRFAERRIGALIVFERAQSLKDYIDIGAVMDALPSADILNAIFDVHSNLHDGAVIVSNQRIACAASVLPLSTSNQLPRRFGTRHRAGVGITEESDCVALIVSEETGNITFAREGTIFTPSDQSLSAMRNLFDSLMENAASDLDRERFWHRYRKILNAEKPEPLALVKQSDEKPEPETVVAEEPQEPPVEPESEVQEPEITSQSCP